MTIIDVLKYIFVNSNRAIYDLVRINSVGVQLHATNFKVDIVIIVAAYIAFTSYTALQTSVSMATGGPWRPMLAVDVLRLI